MAGLQPRSAGLCLLYIVLNAALNFLNRWALGVHGFTFPLALTGAHMLLNPVLLLPVMLAKGLSWQAFSLTLRAQWRGIVIVGLLNGVQIALNNSSLVVMELSLNQVVRAAMPVFVALLAVVVEGRVPTASDLACLVVISIGVMLAVIRPGTVLSSDVTGTILVLSSVAIMALQMSCSGRLGMKLDAVQMTFYTGWISLLPVAGLVVAYELQAVSDHVSAHTSTAMAILLGSCCLAVVYNVVVFETIRGLSSVGSAVLGNVKVVVILLASAVWFGEMQSWAPRQHVGCFFTFGGAAAYSALKILRAKAKQG